MAFSLDLAYFYFFSPCSLVGCLLYSFRSRALLCCSPGISFFFFPKPAAWQPFQYLRSWNKPLEKFTGERSAESGKSLQSINWCLLLIPVLCTGFLVNLLRLCFLSFITMTKKTLIIVKNQTLDHDRRRKLLKPSDFFKKAKLVRVIIWVLLDLFISPH